MAALDWRDRVERLRRVHREEGPPPLAARRRLLARLARGVADAGDEFVAAADEDFGGRLAMETLLADVFAVRRSALHAKRHLGRWARARRVLVDAPFLPATARLVPQPLGVVGVMAPWNYPVQLALVPAVGALAAGNRVAIKPSEATPRTAAIISRVVEAALGGDVATTVEGGAETAEAFAAEPWDHLLFTGSGPIGRSVMKAAADGPTPVTLELGGKCPALVLPGADLRLAARAILEGKLLNGGQTCLAPDTVLVVGRSVEALLAALVEAAAALVPPGAPLTAARRWQRPEVGGDTRIVELADGRLEVAVDPPPDAQVQTTEIFGPLLVLSRSADLDAALAWIRARPAPLAIYVFGADAAGAARLERETTSGALVFEDTVVQAACERLPFGGVGGSGFGRYHGEAGFLTFSNLRTVMRARRPRLADLLMRPWSERKLRLARRLLRGPA